MKAFSPLRTWRSLRGIIGLSIITCSQATIRDVITDLLWFESNVLLGLKFWVLGPQLLLHIWGLWGFGRYNWTGRSESLEGLWRLYLTLFLGLMDSATKAETETSRKQWTKRNLFPSKSFLSQWRRKWSWFNTYCIQYKRLGRWEGVRDIVSAVKWLTRST